MTVSTTTTRLPQERWREHLNCEKNICKHFFSLFVLVFLRFLMHVRIADQRERERVLFPCVVKVQFFVSLDGHMSWTRYLLDPYEICMLHVNWL